jgi:uncharacterized membrane protein
VNRILKFTVFALATVYFVVDAVFLIVAKPMADWIAEHRLFGGIREWIVSLRPYPTLALFAAPLVALEPIKPAAAYLAGTGHVAAGLMLFVVGEILKLVLVERLFAISRNKLMSIPAFAWVFAEYRQIMDGLESSEAWQAVRRWRAIAKGALRRYAMQLKASRKPVRVSVQPR